MTLPHFPNHLGHTRRGWKQRKRHEWQRVVKAFETFRLGCAYTPTQYQELSKLMEQTKQQLSVKGWGR